MITGSEVKELITSTGIGGFEGILRFLNDDEKKELAMLVGMLELGLDSKSLNSSRIVDLAYASYLEIVIK